MEKESSRGKERIGGRRYNCFCQFFYGSLQGQAVKISLNSLFSAETLTNGIFPGAEEIGKFPGFTAIAKWWIMK